MKRGKSIGIGIILFCIIAGAFFGYHQLREQTKLNQIEVKLNETGLLGDIGKRLYDYGYLFCLDWAVLSEKKVDIVIKLPQEDISEDTKNELKLIVDEFLIENKMDPKIFRN